MYFFIQGTRTTPHALMNKGYMKISGNAVSIEDQHFFSKIKKHIGDYIKEPANTTQVDIKLSVVNAASKRSMVEFFKQLESMKLMGFDVIINWKFSKDNEDVKELGEIFNSMFDLQFYLIAV